jgi:hypothetical protein
MPLFALSFALTSYNLRYVTPVSYSVASLLSPFQREGPQGKGKTAKEVLKRIDYGGSATLLAAVSWIILSVQPYNQSFCRRLALFSYS